MNLNLTLFVQFVVFIILAIFTAKVVWPPLMKVIDERAQKNRGRLGSGGTVSKQEMVAVEKRVQTQLSEGA